MKKPIITLAALASILSAQAEIERKRDYPKIYPFVPFATQKIQNDVRKIAEDQKALINIFEISKASLEYQAATTTLPWSSSFWPLVNGGIANPYHDNATAVGNGVRLSKTFRWQKNYKLLKKRREKVHKNVLDLSEEELAKLAPSEKYDLLLGDYTFDLTKRQVEYMTRWGKNKKYSDISELNKVGGGALELAQNYLSWGWVDYDGSPLTMKSALKMAINVIGGIADQYAFALAEKNGDDFNNFEMYLQEGINHAKSIEENYVLSNPGRTIKTWEGICNGWSTAAGNVPRPLHSFKIKLPNGKKLKFYPADVKALLSHTWFYSLLQDQKTQDGSYGGSISQGLRCNEGKPAVDEWGRFYDDRPDQYANKGIIEPRCVGVHPATWHLSLVNIIGKQGRSFVVERKIKKAVDNHPMSDYKFEYFNPYNGEYGNLLDSIRRINPSDQFKKFRNPDTQYIVGVKTTMAYLDWVRPRREDKESEQEDFQNRVERPMLYDLELDSKGNIIGGQWRATEVGKSFLGLGYTRNQPDFFWIITKDWKKTGYVNDLTFLPKWEDTTKTPPKEWKQSALFSHKFIYEKNPRTNWYEKCEVQNKNKKSERYKVPCELKENRPFPLTNVVNKLLELSRQ